MDQDKIKDLEEKIADLKARLPAHSVKPAMIQQLEELENELEKAKAESKTSPFDEHATDYDTWYDEEGKLAFEIELRAIQETLPSLTLKPWLEIGVGSGRFSKALGIDTGLDPSVELAEIARGRGITVHQGKGEQTPFSKESFGAVFMIVTMCFVDTPPEVLREAYRILKPGGKVVLGVVLRESPWGKYYVEEKKKGHPFYKYATFYSYEELTEMMKQAGFTTERVISTLFQKQDEVKEMELPQNDYNADAGFTVLMAGKK